MKRPVCRKCGAVFEIGRRRTQESVDRGAADAGWLIGLPGGEALCPDHWEVLWEGTTVVPPRQN